MLIKPTRRDVLKYGATSFAMRRLHAQSWFFGANKAAGGAGGPAFVHGNSGQTVNTSITVSITVSTGNLVWLFTENPSAQTITSVSDGVNTYTKIDEITTGGIGASHWYAKNVTGGTLNILVTPSSTASIGVTVMELSGCDPTTPLDTSISTFNGSGTLTSGAFTTTMANAIIVAGAGNYYGTGIVWTAGMIGAGTAAIPASVTAGGGDAQANVTSEYLAVSTIQTGITAEVDNNVTTYGTIMVAVFK